MQVIYKSDNRREGKELDCNILFHCELYVYATYNPSIVSVYNLIKCKYG